MFELFWIFNKMIDHGKYILKCLQHLELIVHSSLDWISILSNATSELCTLVKPVKVFPSTQATNHGFCKTCRPPTHV